MKTLIAITLTLLYGAAITYSSFVINSIAQDMTGLTEGRNVGSLLPLTLAITIGLYFGLLASGFLFRSRRRRKILVGTASVMLFYGCLLGSDLTSAVFLFVVITVLSSAILFPLILSVPTNSVPVTSRES